MKLPQPSCDRPRLLTLDEAAHILRLDVGHANPRRAVRHMVSKRRLVGVLVGRRLLVTPESVDAYISGAAQ